MLLRGIQYIDRVKKQDRCSPSIASCITGSALYILRQLAIGTWGECLFALVSNAPAGIHSLVAAAGLAGSHRCRVVVVRVTGSRHTAVEVCPTSVSAA